MSDATLDWPEYRSTRLRHPKRAAVVVPSRDVTGPLFTTRDLDEHDDDLTLHGTGEPLGERIVVTGRVLDEDGRPVRNALVEVWQANAAGRYFHDADLHPAPLDPNFTGAGRTLTRISGIVEAGIPVMGHIGLTPQSATQLGGYKAQGRTAAAAGRLVEEARALERAGCFAVVLEAMPAVVADEITAALRVPTIGIGAGAGCSGQVLVWHDLLGLTQGPMPRFVKTYARLREPIEAAIRAYAEDVRSGSFPAREHTYSMPDLEIEKFASRGVSRKN